MDDKIYRHLLKTAPFGYAYHKIILDEDQNPIDYTFLEINNYFEEITGLKKEVVINKTVKEVIPNIVNDDFNWISLYGNIALTGGDGEFEQYSASLKKWFKVQVYSPEKYYFFTIFLDITREKEESRELENFFSINLDLLCIANLDGQFLKLNRAWEDILGYSINELENSRFLDFVHPEDMNSTLEAMSKLGNNEIVLNFVNRYRSNNGTYRFIEWRSKPFGNLIYAAARDITEHIEMEIALANEKQRLVDIIEGTNVGTWEWNVQTGETVFNERWAEIIGYTLEEISPISIDTWMKYANPDDLKESQKLLKKHFNKELDYYEFESRMKHKDGSWVWVSDRGRVSVWDKDGKPLLMYGTHQDTTERKRIEERLKQSEENFRTFFETIDDMIFIANSDGKIFFTNSSVTKKLGYSEDELIKMHVLDVHPKEIRKDAETIFADMFAGKRDRCPLPLAKKDGSTVPVETRVWFGKWDGKDSLFGVSKDLSKEQESLQMFNKIFENNPALMAISSITNREFINVNQAFLTKLGYEKDEIIGKKASDLSIFVDDDIQKKVVQELNLNGKIGNVELKLRTKKGEILDGLFSGEVIDSQGNSFFLTVMTDITPQKEAEKAAYATSRAKSDFLANMSHEIRTPLNGVIGFTDLLKNTQLNDLQKQYVDNASNSAHTLLGIINDILDFSKIEAGKIELDIIKTDIIELMENATDIVKYQASNKNIELLLNIEPNLPRFGYIDPIRLKQIMVNLLGNAIKFTEKGEIEFKVTFYKINDQNGKYNFFVRDTGIGITKEQQSKLFKAFSQADTSTTRKFGGTGLGLIISNLLAQKMGSKIELESENGKGSVFYFSIETDYQYGDKFTIEDINYIKKVLIIDDNENNILILKETFRNWNIECIGCLNGYDALKILESQRNFDVIIVDYIMPYLDGLATIKLIREKLKLYPENYPVILLHSSSNKTEIIDECRKLGVRFNISKPVKLRELFNYLVNLNKNEYSENKNVTDNSKKDVEILNVDKSVILIAEDVLMNMILIKTMVLQHIPNAEILEAKNGIETLELVINRKIDLILMDVQMPEMDGIEATKEIRKYDFERSTHTPIVALTAGAIKEEKDRCLEAGMDDFLTKPIENQNLVMILRKYIEKKDVNISIETIMSKIDDLPIFLKEKLLIKIGGDKEFCDNLIQVGYNDISVYMDELIISIENGNYKEIKNNSHKIKGAALNMYFDRIGYLAKFIEEYSEKDINIVKKLSLRIKNEWDELKKVLKE